MWYARYGGLAALLKGSLKVMNLLGVVDLDEQHPQCFPFCRVSSVLARTVLYVKAYLALARSLRKVGYVDVDGVVDLGARLPSILRALQAPRLLMPPSISYIISSTLLILTIDKDR